MTDWLTAPYYIAPPEVRVDVPWYGSLPTAESMMQVLAGQLLNYPQGFLFGAAGSGADKPEQLRSEILAYAQTLKDAPVAAFTAADFVPTESADTYYMLVVNTLKRIQASRFDWTQPPTASVYDVWISRVGV